MSRTELESRSTPRRVADVVLGVLTLLVGVLLIFTPGPASLVIPVALALLGREFRWARQSSLVLRRKLRNLVRRRREPTLVRRPRHSLKTGSPVTRAA